MKNTKAALLWIGLIFLSCAMFCAWIIFCWHISHGAAWGLALALGALAVPFLAFAIYKDLSA